MAPERISRRVCLTGALAGLCLFGLRPGSGHANHTPKSHMIEVDGVPLRFVQYGEGPPVVLLHGASGNLNDMTFRLAPAIAARGYSVISFDRPGHGRSGWPDEGGESLSGQAALMRQALRQMGITETTLIGHSYGGSVALAWALDDPLSVTRLMLISAPSQVWEGGLGLSTSLLANPLTGPVLAHTAPALVTGNFVRSAAGAVFAPQAMPEGYLDHLDLDLVLQPASLRANARQLDTLKQQLGPMMPVYSALDMPVELVHGTADTTVGLDIHSAVLVEQIPGARLTRLEGIGHMPHQVALPEVLAVFDRLETSPAP